jgi:alkanesulfonate monooxygenase SsuD/methylene tetrahydromethanopterin reductase-like flavin-dependent oxidoreductase (luciferase family)
MQIGCVILPDLRWRDAAPVWQRVEALGFDHAWTYDHLAWRALRDGPWFGAMGTLTAAALATERIRIGPLVASPNFRHPVSFAKELVTLDDVSDGRLILGIGAGGTGWDATMLGQDPWSPQERGARFVEFVDLTDRLLRVGATSWEGQYYTAREARTWPGCVQRPRMPFAVAAIGPTGMRVAARHGAIWVTTGDRRAEEQMPARDGAALVAAQMARLDAACADVGRDPGTLRRMVLTGGELDAGLSSVEQFHDTVGHYAAVGVTDLVVPWPRAAEPYVGDVATFERIFASRSPQ